MATAVAHSRVRLLAEAAVAAATRQPRREEAAAESVRAGLPSPIEKVGTALPSQTRRVAAAVPLRHCCLRGGTQGKLGCAKSPAHWWSAAQRPPLQTTCSLPRCACWPERMPESWSRPTPRRGSTSQSPLSHHSYPPSSQAPRPHPPLHRGAALFCCCASPPFAAVAPPISCARSWLSAC